MLEVKSLNGESLLKTCAKWGLSVLLQSIIYKLHDILQVLDNFSDL